MELNDFVAKFAAQFEETDLSEIKAETKFHELDEWSSLLGLGIIAMVDEEYNVALKGNDIKAAITIQDLYEIVKNKQ